MPEANTQHRSSKFREVGLEDDFAAPAIPEKRATRRPAVRFDSQPEVHLFEREQHEFTAITPGNGRSGSTQSPSGVTAPTGQAGSSLFGRNAPIMFRIGTIALVVASLVPFLRGSPAGTTSPLPIQGVEGGPIPRDTKADEGIILTRQDDTSTEVCFRWAQQSAMVNGTLYLYGGQASTEQGQDQDTWNNDFLTLDLTRTWNIAAPSLTKLPQSSGSSAPPAVALGYLWSSHESLFLYGGQFSWKPVESPTAFSTWEYSMASEKWIEHSNPQTAKGESAPSDGDSVQRASEGAGVNVPSLGRGFYFGGHLDGYTTKGWSQSVPRVYLQSLLEYTFPGYSNDQVTTLSDGKTASDNGSYRNVTEGGIQDRSGFTKRADGKYLSRILKKRSAC
jgi:hypothetical protein